MKALPCMALFKRLGLVASRGLLLLFVLSPPASAGEQSGEAQTAKRIALILDASGSMNAKLADGQSRIAAARAAASDMVAKLPATTEIALHVYGHRSPPAEKNCQDTELVVPFGPASSNATTIQSRIAGINALGFTPISLSLQGAAKSLGEGEAGGTIVLVSDGKETCKSDPCAVARALAKANASLVIHTIGFGADAATRLQLQCIASVARGTYFDAGSAGELSRRMGEAAAREAKADAVPPAETRSAPDTGILTVRGIDEAGVAVINAVTGQIVGTVGWVGGNREALPPGIYGVQFTNGLWTGVEIKAGQTTELVPAYLKIENASAANISFIEPETGEEIAAVHQQSVPLIALMPGSYHLRLNDAFEYRDVGFKAGQTTVIKPAVIRITSGRENYNYIVRGADGTTGLGGIAGQDISLPAGTYSVLDPEDETKAVTIEAKEGRTVEISMPR